MNIHRTTCAAPNADLRELLEQIEKVMQAAWVVVYKDVQPLGSQVEGAFRPAKVALRSHSNNAALSSRAACDGLIGWHL